MDSNISIGFPVPTDELKLQLWRWLKPSEHLPTQDTRNPTSRGNPLRYRSTGLHLGLLLLAFVLPAARLPGLLSLGQTNWAVLAGLPACGIGEDASTTATRFDRAERASADTAAPHLEEGRWRFSRGERELAIEALREALRLSPESQAAHFFLGSALAEAGRIEEAAGEFRRSGLNPHDPGEFDFLAEKAWHYVLSARSANPGAEDWSRAEDYYRVSLAAFPQYRQYWRNLAIFYLDLKPGDAARGIEVLEEAAEAFPQSSWPNLDAATYFQRIGDPARALSEIRTALMRDPYEEEGYRLATRILVDSGPRVAKAWIRSVRADCPDNRYVESRLGDLVRVLDDRFRRQP